MKLFGTNDGVLNVILAFFQITAIIFGAYAYYNTVHPVFVKERELLETKSELESLKKTKGELAKDISSMRRNADSLTIEINKRTTRIAELESTTAELRA